MASARPLPQQARRHSITASLSHSAAARNHRLRQSNSAPVLPPCVPIFLFSIVDFENTMVDVISKITWSLVGSEDMIVTAAQAIVSFLAGAASVVGTYLAWRQIRRGDQRIELLEAHCEPRVPNEWHDRGFPFSFRMFLMNRSSGEHALTTIEVRLSSLRLRRFVHRKSGPKACTKWMELTFEDVLHQLGGEYAPLVLKPYEYRELYGFWWDRIGRPENLRDKPNLREVHQEVHRQLMIGNVEYRLTHGDGTTRRFKFKK